jgi:hypothetical protein
MIATFRILALWLFVVGSVQHAHANHAAQVVWGTVTNGYRLGVHMQREFSAGKEASHRTILYFGTTNLAQTNMCFCPESTRAYKLVLRDSDGKEITKTKMGKQHGNLPPSQARVRDRPLRQWRVLIVPQPWDVQMGAFNLVEHFDLRKSGNYQLEIEARVYQQNSQGQLELCVLPPVTMKFSYLHAEEK